MGIDTRISQILLSVTGTEKHAKAAGLNKAKSENRYSPFPPTIFQNKERRPATTA
jgi:hypothetical protein